MSFNDSVSIILRILLFSDNVSMDISHNDNTMFKGTKQGRIYLTTHRMIFNNKIMTDHLKSFSFPFIMMSEVRLFNRLIRD